MRARSYCSANPQKSSTKGGCNDAQTMAAAAAAATQISMDGVSSSSFIKAEGHIH